MFSRRRDFWISMVLVTLAALLLTACSTPAGEVALPAAAVAPGSEPTLTPLALDDGERLRVVATTNIVADVAANVGGDLIELTGLLPVGADPHSYEARPADLRALNDAHMVFTNGLLLEEALAPELTDLDSGAPVIALSDGLAVRRFGADGDAAHQHEEEAHADEAGHAEDEVHADEEAHAEGEAHADEADHADEAGHAEDEAHDHAAGSADPHVWMDVANVIEWSEIIAARLREADPANAARYAANAAAYQAELRELDEAIQTLTATVPDTQRKLVTDHEALGYFADRYGFTVVGTVIPSLSTLAAPSARDLAALQEQIKAEGVSAIFVSTTVSPVTAEQTAADLGIAIVPLYTGSLSAPDGPAATYIDLMRYAATAIVEALE